MTTMRYFKCLCPSKAVQGWEGIFMSQHQPNTVANLHKVESSLLNTTAVSTLVYYMLLQHGALRHMIPLQT